MRKVIVSEFLTLDGVYQAPGSAEEDTSGGFEHGGWQLPYFEDLAGQEISETMASTGAFLLGRRTYEIFAAFWPTQPDDDPLAATLNGLPKYVVSATLGEPLAWQNATLIRDDVAAAVARLKDEPGTDIQVMGSGELTQTLMEHGLIDEYRLMINPILLGSGKRLFRDGGPRIPLRLVDSKTTSTGVLILTYAPADSDRVAT